MKKKFLILLSCLILGITLANPREANAEAVLKLVPDAEKFTVETMKEIGKTQGQVTFINKEAEDKFYRDLYKKNANQKVMKDFLKTGSTVARVGGKVVLRVSKGASLLGLASMVIDALGGLDALQKSGEKQMDVTYDIPEDSYTEDAVLSGEFWKIELLGDVFPIKKGDEKIYVRKGSNVRVYYFTDDGTWSYKSIPTDFIKAGSLFTSESAIKTDYRGNKHRTVDLTYQTSLGMTMRMPVETNVGLSPRPDYVPGKVTRTSTIPLEVVRPNPNPLPNPWTDPAKEYEFEVPFPSDEPIYRPDGELVAKPNENPEPNPRPEEKPDKQPDGNPDKKPEKVPDKLEIDWQPLMVGLGTIKEKFPFSIPWDLSNQLSVFDVKPKAPKVTIDFSSFPGVKDLKVDLSLESFDSVATGMRWLLTIAMDIAFILMLRRLLPE